MTNIWQKMLQIDKIFMFFAQFNDWLLLRLGITCPIKFKLDLSMVIVCFVWQLIGGEHTIEVKGFKLLTPNPSYLELVHRYVKRTDCSFFWPHPPWVIYPTNMTTSYRIWAVVTRVVCCVVIVLLWVANLERRLLDLTLLDHDDDECTQIGLGWSLWKLG